MRLVAITGSIGCGKTTISGVLRKFGYLVYDIDKWVKYIYYNPNFLEIIKKHFPETFENNKFNKRKLRNIVFDNADRLKILEGLIHPFLTERLRKIIRYNRNKGIVFVDVALLFEMGWDKYFDEVILADVDLETQRKRVMLRDNISSDDFDKINKLQMPREEKIKKVDFIVNTNVSNNVLRVSLLDIVEELELCNL